MGLKKGMTNNTAGRPKGTKNKVSTETRETMKDFLNMSLSDLKNRYEKLKDSDKIKLVGYFLPYVVNKLEPEPEEKIKEDHKIRIEYVPSNNEK